MNIYFGMQVIIILKVLILHPNATNAAGLPAAFFMAFFENFVAFNHGFDKLMR